VHLLYHGFHFHRTALSRFFTLFPFRPQSLLTTKRSPVTHTTYWHRAHTSKTKLPILFIHGIGIGLLPYVNFLADLNSKTGLEDGGPDDQVGIIAIEIMPISFRITHPALSKDETCAEIATILAHHGWDKVVLVSHSYGTVISTHLLKTPSIAPLIGPVVLIDPVSILLHLPDVAYNFTRRRPKMANEHQLWYFASMDMGVSHTLARHFFWSENILWKEDIGDRNLTVSLSGRDLIVDTNSVGRYMASGTTPLSLESVSSSVLINIDGSPEPEAQPDGKSSITRTRVVNFEADEDRLVTDEWKERPWKGKGIDVLWFQTLDHAQVFDQASTRRPLLHAIKTYCEEGIEWSNGGVDV
jgi:pimeloyl-ACP methyl ester carboxylesterase